MALHDKNKTISPVYARLVLREMQKLGIDSSGLFVGTPLSTKELLHGGDLPMSHFLQILRNAHALAPDMELGFMLGRNANIYTLGALGAGMAVAPSMREGLRLLESYTRLHTSYMDVAARPNIHGLTISILYDSNTEELERFHTETAVLLLQQYAEMLLGEPMCEAHYRLAIATPVSTKRYEQALHGTVSFNARISEIDIAKKCLDTPSPFYESELWNHTQISLSQRLKELGGSVDLPYTQHVTVLLGTSEPPLPDLSEIARDLHVSERTLNRRLQEESTSYRELKSAALLEWARLHLVNTSQTVEAIAATLGYKDTANFRRAFRKSQGCSPTEYRAGAQIKVTAGLQETKRKLQ